LRFCRRAAPNGKGEHPDHPNLTVQRQRKDLTNGNLYMGTHHSVAIDPEMAIGYNPLRQSAGFGKPRKEQELVEPHEGRVNSVASWREPRRPH
jgi:hypothetical protein